MKAYKLVLRPGDVERTWRGVCMFTHLHPWMEAGGAQLSPGSLRSLQGAGMGRAPVG